MESSPQRAGSAGGNIPEGQAVSLDGKNGAYGGRREAEGEKGETVGNSALSPLFGLAELCIF